jgi:hypothetical protein
MNSENNLKGKGPLRQLQVLFVVDWPDQVKRVLIVTPAFFVKEVTLRQLEMQSILAKVKTAQSRSKIL